ncbi:transposable element Tcb2 transposase [Trichonephila clavipes]|uniref:Transposable element Tcb2 transposase n=1 Tax=Trichonephila clavipes TaxID=2585209 RepID=A0A8X6SE57_TRICX|nr:transposable element Tcb2 transposase [Trichonephila clavipes]
MNSITERRVIHQVKIDPKISAPKSAASTSNTLGRSVSAETVRRVLRKAGYNGRVARKKPLIVTVVVWCGKTEYLTPPKTNNSYCEARRWVGDGLGVYGCVGVGKLVFIDGIMHKKAYLNILQNNLKESADKLGLGSNFIFQQDNDPKHTAFVVNEWLLYHCRNQLNTPPQSPDLNFIENLRSHLERAVQKHQITSKEQLKSVLQEEWLNIAPETTRHLVESMPRRLEAVISAKVLPCEKDDDCSDNKKCRDSDEKGVKTCQCPPGKSGKGCVKIDDCETGKYNDCKGDKGKCEYDDSEEKAVCTCEDGRVLDETAGYCKVLPCEKDDDCSDNKKCRDSDEKGVKTCQCPPGKSGKGCVKIDDCETGKYNDCKGDKGKCEYDDSEEKAVCICEDGRVLDETAGYCKVLPCEKDDDCSDNKKCRDSDEKGVKTCQCPPGKSGKGCVKIDDCETGKYNDCKGDKGTCEYDVSEEKAVCTCEDGRVLDETAGYCKDDCETGKYNDCKGDKGKCAYDDSEEKAVCTCEDGRVLDETAGYCKVLPCEKDDDCSDNKKCRDSDEKGVKTCQCPPGKSGKGCVKIDDCETGKYNDCKGDKGKCEYDDSEEKAICTCEDGRVLDETAGYCKVLPCEKDDDCSDNKKCRDSDEKGVKTCQCPPGKSGKGCVKIDDCETGKYNDCKG